MIDREVQRSDFGERLDADAVCAQCGTVNPERTLICKTCGNNLRDQRTLRLSADQILDGEAEPIPRRKFLLGALAVLGILLALWTAWNVEAIADWLVDIQRPSVVGSQTLWTDVEGAVFSELLDELEHTTLSRAERRESLSNPVKGDTVDGIYVVGVENAVLGRTPKGIANTRMRDGEIFFVALLGEDMQIRGRAQNQGNSFLVEWEDASARRSGETFAVCGIALKKPDGSFECFGQSELSEEGYPFIACLASQAPAQPAQDEEIL